jgi:hypothetical protein
MIHAVAEHGGFPAASGPHRHEVEAGAALGRR